MNDAERKRRNTASARRMRNARRAKQLEQELRTATHCPWPVSGGKPCGGALHTETNPLTGATVIRCEWCERRIAGICRDCPRPVEGMIGRALRCAHHKAAARQLQVDASRERHRKERLAAARAAYHADPARRERRNEYKRRWRKANPEKVNEQRRRYVERHGKEPDSGYLDYHRRYNSDPARQAAKRAERKAALDRERATRPAPTCRKCGKEVEWPLRGRPVRTCDDCCWPHQRRERAENRARLEAQRAAELVAPPAPAPKRSRRLKVTKPQPAKYQDGYRLCVSPGCDRVLTGRKKKCSACRERDRQLAQLALGSVRGRGRRTDLEQRRSA